VPHRLLNRERASPRDTKNKLKYKIEGKKRGEKNWILASKKVCKLKFRRKRKNGTRTIYSEIFGVCFETGNGLPGLSNKHENINWLFVLVITTKRHCKSAKIQFCVV
jgi:hypothetical protein